MQMRIRAVLMAVLLMLAGAGGAADLKAVCQVDRPPYSYIDAHGAYAGIEIDIVSAVLQRLGDTITYRVVPNVRLLYVLKQGDADLAVTTRGRDGDGLFFSDDFVEYENVAITRKAKQIVLNTLTDLDRYDFVIWQNGWRDLGPQFEAKYRPSARSEFPANYRQLSSQEAQNKMFWTGRVDVLVVDRAIFAWYRKQLAGMFDTSDEVVYHTIIPGHTTFQVGFRDRDLRDRFNATLKALRADGTYQKILDKYK
jgi:polar amino acid transport system substrate-binding protein